MSFETNNFLRETQNVFRDTNNFLRETNCMSFETRLISFGKQYVFRDTTNFLRETQHVFNSRHNLFPSENTRCLPRHDNTISFVCSVKSCHAYLMKTVRSYKYMITSCDVIISDERVSHVHMLTFCKCKQKDSRSRLHLQKWSIQVLLNQKYYCSVNSSFEFGNALNLQGSSILDSLRMLVSP